MLIGVCEVDLRLTEMYSRINVCRIKVLTDKNTFGDVFKMKYEKSYHRTQTLRANITSAANF